MPPAAGALRALVLATAFLAPAVVAHAQEPSNETSETVEPREFRFGFHVFGGYHWFATEHPLGREPGDPQELAPKNAGTFGGRLALNFNRWVGLEAELSGYRTKTRDKQSDLWIFGYRGHLILYLAPSYHFRPFILGGYGGLTSLVSNEQAAKNDTYGFLHAGIGFKIGFTEVTGIRLEYRLMGPWTVLDPVIPRGNRVKVSGADFELLASLYLNFGEIPSGRTIFNKQVVMVPPAPPPAPPVNPDPDGDGIAGKSDKCPEIAEDKDGFEDEDGCPEADNDKDGIPDQLDQCPNKPETKNGIDDDDGCPEEDLDGDGIIGSRDRCPNDPETKNGFQDTDGCPDEVPAAVKKFTGVIEGINFKTGSAEILQGSYAILERAVKVLSEFSDVMLEISGHTDNRGRADFNRDLSQRRADSVKNFFVLRGIKTERLTSIGYGMDRPIADNATEYGRSKNRRTEFRLITSP